MQPRDSFCRFHEEAARVCSSRFVSQRLQMTTTTEAPPLHSIEPSLVRTHRAAVIIKPGVVELHDLPVPPMPHRHVRVRVTHCGVCSSSVPTWEGRPWFRYPLPPGALGHEAIGVIESIGNDVDGWNVGDRVAYIGERGFAEYEVVPVETLFALPPQLGDTLFLAEPLACTMNVYRRAGIKPGDTVAIVGIGFLGTLLTQLALHGGARVIGIGRRDSSLEPARLFGAECIAATDAQTIIQQVARLTDAKLCDVVIEATGHQEPLDLASQLTRIRGRLVIAGYHQDGLRQVNMQLWNWRGIDVINAHERDPSIYLEGMQLALDAVEQGRLVTTGLITHRFPLDQLATALTMTATRPPGFVKAVIES
jgi:NADPH:quinone reductase